MDVEFPVSAEGGAVAGCGGEGVDEEAAMRLVRIGLVWGAQTVGVGFTAPLKDIKPGSVFESEVARLIRAEMSCVISAIWLFRLMFLSIATN